MNHYLHSVVSLHSHNQFHAQCSNVHNCIISQSENYMPGPTNNQNGTAPPPSQNKH